MPRAADAVTLAYLHDDEVTHSFHVSLTNTVMADLAGGKRLQRGRYISQYGSGAMTFASARNKVVKAWLDDYDSPWLWWVDSDMGWEPDALERLLAVADPEARPVVGGLCFGHTPLDDDGMNGRHYRPFPTIYNYAERGDTEGFYPLYGYAPATVMRCDGTGSAFLVIHRTVMERMRERWGDTWYDHLPRPSGGVFGEDLSFCMRLGALGIPVHVHTGVKTNHYKQTFLQESSFHEGLTAPAATDEVDVIVPVLHRPKNVEPFMRTLRASTGLATAWFVTEPGDLLERAEVEKHGGRVIVHPGKFAEKANVAFGQTSAPWVFLAGDDVAFHPGWLDHCQQVARVTGARVVGTNDLANRRSMEGEHSGHLLIARDYVDEVGASWDGPGVLCHEGYRHNFVDHEIVSAAKLRGVWGMALAAVVQHLHPITGKVKRDDIYKVGDESYEADHKIYRARRARHAA